MSTRKPDQERNLSFIPHFTPTADGSVLVKTGNTHVLCNASLREGTPPFLQDKKQGWLTAEYTMLPCATSPRSDRKGTLNSGRTQEIQRLIGRSLRAAIDLTQIENYTVIIDCDVLQADGGTRTASITGAYTALYLSLKKKFPATYKTILPLQIAALSVGVVNREVQLDLDYSQDSQADVDMNCVMTNENKFIELQGTAEKEAFSLVQLQHMLELAQAGIQRHFHVMNELFQHLT